MTSQKLPPPAVRSVGDGFWNIRGSFHLGPIDLGTQTSLVRLEDGRHVFLDSYALDDPSRRWAESVVGDAGPSAIINLHPFHTIHVRAMATMFPRAKLYGTARHHAKLPDLPWAPERTEGADFPALFDDFEFSVPRGVAFVADNDNLHFASVLALHRASGVLHVDDTLSVTRLPKLLRRFEREAVFLHPSLPFVLDKRAGAAADFRAWAAELVELCKGATTLCAAHSAILTADDERSIADRVAKAVRLLRPVVDLHERRYG